MANEQVRIDLTANDKASRTIDDVADSAEKLERLDPEVDVSADDKASPTLDKVTDAAEAIDRLSPEVQIGADADAANRAIADVRGDAEALARADHELVLKARVDAARAELKTLRGDLDQTAEKAEATNRALDRVDRGGGSNLRGNAIADLTGPLGDASSAASDFAGVFDGLGDISESVAGKVGVSASTMATAIGGVGVAVAAGAAAWTYFRQKQEEARRKQRELTDATKEFLEAYRTGQIVQATDKLVDKWGDLLNLADRLGVSVGDVTDVLSGQATTVPGLSDKVADLEAKWRKAVETGDAHGTVLRDQFLAYRDLQSQVDDAAGAYSSANDELARTDRVSRNVSAALRTQSGETDKLTSAADRAEAATRGVNEQLDRMRGALNMEQAIIDWRDAFARAMNDAGQTTDEQAADVIALKQSIIDAGEAVGKSPWQIQTELDKVDDGDMQTVKNDVEAWYRLYPVTLASRLDRPGQGGGTAAGGGTGPRAVEVPTIGVLNMTLPAGWRGDPVRAAHVQRRRAGRYYARSG